MFIQRLNKGFPYQLIIFTLQFFPLLNSSFLTFIKISTERKSNLVYRVRLKYHKGTIIVDGNLYLPYFSYDPRIRAYRALACYYDQIKRYLDENRIDYEDRVLDLLPFPYISSKVELRPYQEEALKAWMRAGKKGVIVLPTGAGKTVIGIKAIEVVNAPSLIVVPTLELLNQWREVLEREFGVEVGVIGGGKQELKPITVITYDSAYLKAEWLGNKFSLLIFDEAHHLPSHGYRQIAELSAAPYRLGLTATIEREDGLHVDLPRLVGEKVYEVKPRDLAGRYLADYEVERIKVDLTPEEKEEYKKYWSVYTNYLKNRNLKMRSLEDFERFLTIASYDKEGREALLARHRALKIALNSEAKLTLLAQLLKMYRGYKTIIFTQHNELVHRIANRFLIPFITHKTSKEERREILRGFKEGRYTRIVTSKVLDEGVDVPDASLGIIISGTGSRREFIQRLGRLLRPKEGKKAKLIEIVSVETKELQLSYKRHRGRSI